MIQTDAGDAITHLDRIRDTIRPLICSTKHALYDTDADFLAHSPAEVDIARQIAAKRHRAYFGRIRDSEGLAIMIPQASANFG